MDTLESGAAQGADRRGPIGRWAAYAVVVALAVGVGFVVGRDHGGSGREVGVEPRSSAGAESALRAPPVAGSLKTHHYRLKTRGRAIEVTVDLVGATTPKAPTMRVTVIGHVEHGKPEHRYQLVGGRCPSSDLRHRQVWATGRTDADGAAVLRGGPSLLSKLSAYWLVVRPWPRASRATDSGPRRR